MKQSQNTSSTKTALTAEDVAHILRVSKATVYNLRNRGELTGYTVGRKLRFTPSDVEDYMAAHHDAGTIRANLEGSSAESREQSWSGLSDVSHRIEHDRRSTAHGFSMSGHDVMLDIVGNYLVQMGIAVKRVQKSSYDGLVALYHDEVDIAATHLWDPQSGEYNIPYAKRLVPGCKTAIIRLTSRMQGFIVPAGNPKRLSGWEDFAQSNLIIANSERGTGTRVLLDEHLRIMDIDPHSIMGYYEESSSPIMLAKRVVRGAADCMLGTEKLAQLVDGVDFIPLQREDYDLVLKQERFDDPSMRAMLDLLESGLLKRDLTGFVGYDTSDTGRITWLN